MLTRDEVNRRFRDTALKRIGIPLLLAVLMGAALLWVTLEKSISALYAAHAESLLGAAGTERGAEWSPDLRARVIIRSVSYFDAASKLGPRWLPDQWAQKVILGNIARLHIHEYLPTMTNDELQERARRAFDFTSRVILGRSFVITKLERKSASEQSHNCHVIGGDLNDWQQLQPGQLADAPHLQRAYRVKDVDAQGQRTKQLEFGAADESGGFKLAASDLQISLPTGAWLCLSPDGTVLSLSSPGQNYPDLYELQWTRCAAESYCTKVFDWRVRYVPIDYAPGANVLPQPSFPCVTSIRRVPAGLEELKSVKIEAQYTAEKTPVCTGIRPSEIYVAEFFTGLAAPRTIEIPAQIEGLLTPCLKNGPSPDAEYICKPANFVSWNAGERSGKFSSKDVNETVITIRKRPRENDILEVDVKDKNSGRFAASKVSLPAARIDRAGVTESGDVLLHDDGADVTWRFVGARSGLEDLLRQRGDCANLQKFDKNASQKRENPYPDLRELADLNIDSVCLR
jgi:hypothetical protein